MKRLFKRIFRYYGYEIKKSNLRDDHFKRRMTLINSYNINKVLDVGANTGQYGNRMRAIGFKGKIVSFEPLISCYQELLNQTQFDNNWTAFNYALGNFDGMTTINIAGNKESSSILEMLPNHIKFRPNSKYIGQEDIQVHKLDTISGSIFEKDDIVYLKIDAQGYEFNILEGASEYLSRIHGVQLEMSFERLYANEKVMCDLIEYMANRNFKLMSIEPGSVDIKTGQMFQVDGVFFRTF